VFRHAASSPAIRTPHSSAGSPRTSSEGFFRPRKAKKRRGLRPGRSIPPWPCESGARTARPKKSKTPPFEKRWAGEAGPRPGNPSMHGACQTRRGPDSAVSTGRKCPDSVTHAAESASRGAPSRRHVGAAQSSGAQHFAAAGSSPGHRPCPGLEYVSSPLLYDPRGLRFRGAPTPLPTPGEVS